jgi:hypothetical protein
MACAVLFRPVVDTITPGIMAHGSIVSSLPNPRAGRCAARRAALRADLPRCPVLPSCDRAARGFLADP